MPYQRPLALGMFYGDQGDAGAALPATDASPLCPFLDQKRKSFCTLDEDMCPFVGFTYRRCRKYIHNIARTGSARRRVSQVSGSIVPSKKGAVRVTEASVGGLRRRRKPLGLEEKAKDPAVSVEDFRRDVGSMLAALPDSLRGKLFRGTGPIRNEATLYARAEDLAKGPDGPQKLAALHRHYTGRLKDLETAARSQQKVLDQWDRQVEVLQRTDPTAEAALRFLRTDQRQLSRTEGLLNKVMGKLVRYDLRFRDIPGGGTIPKVFLEPLIPRFKREDYEVARMSEQAGLTAIMKQHRYGKEFGRYTARNLLIKQIVMPFVMLVLGAPELIKPLASMWPQGWIDARFFAKREEIPKLSREERFLASQKIASGRGRKLRQKWDVEAGLPPDVAAPGPGRRALPVTGRARKKSLAALRKERRRRAVETGPEAWRRSYA